MHNFNLLNSKKTHGSALGHNLILLDYGIHLTCESFKYWDNLGLFLELGKVTNEAYKEVLATLLD